MQAHDRSTAASSGPPQRGVAEGTLPSDALLKRYGGEQGYADCYVATLPCRVSQAQYVEAFYTTRLFKLERWLLARMGYACTDDQARQLAAGERDRFAAWTVEERCADQLLLRDAAGGTRSWLMATPAEGGGTVLHFGSAVVPRRTGGSAKPRMGWVFHALLGFHKLYSRALLDAARRSLVRCASA